MAVLVPKTGLHALPKTRQSGTVRHRRIIRIHIHVTLPVRRPRPRFSGPVAALVQGGHLPVPGTQPAAAGYRWPGCSRLGAGARIHLHPGHGAEVLPADAWRPAANRSLAVADDHATGAVRGTAAQLPGDPAADVHGRRYPFHEGAAAVPVFAHFARGALEGRSGVAVLCAGSAPSCAAC